MKDRVSDAKSDHDKREIGVRPRELSLEIWRQNAQRLAIDVVDDGRRKQQRTDPPAELHFTSAKATSDPPVATAMYCLPLYEYEMGGASIGPPVRNFQSTLPDRASSAIRYPKPSPANTRPPAVASNPPGGPPTMSHRHFVLPVVGSTASSAPCEGSRGIRSAVLA